MIMGDIDAPLDKVQRAVSTTAGWAYLKIAEGCDHHCAYCVIPSLRGKFRSRPFDGLIEEAKDLVDLGVRELILVAQDTTRYGLDLYEERRLPELIRALAQIDGLDWIRIHYLYPDGIDDALIEAIAETPKVLRYLDIPIQHIDDEILKKMGRSYTGDFVRDLFSRLRERLPGLVLRSSLIVGLPGEGEEEFLTLAEFLQCKKIERAGVFCYSPQEGTPAYTMPNRPTSEEVEARANRLRYLQDGIIDAFHAERLGSVVDVLIEGFDGERKEYFGRSFAESPEVDGQIWVKSQISLDIGMIYPVCLEAEEDGELIGKVEDDDSSK